jgi:hypothetical protein
MSIFETADRKKLRFLTTQGQLSAEELWDLSLASLNSLAMSVNKQLRDEGEESFLSTAAKSCTNNSLRLDILKHVITTKEAEQATRKARTEKMATIAKLKDLAEAKTTEQLASKSLEDIMKQISELEAQMV